jgi:mannose-1-phosphate guanylyltransferase
MKKTAIIMAGGFGERFWPLSRMKRPKQILNLTNKSMNMMQEAIERISSLINPEDIFVITSKDLLEPIRNSIKNIPPENIIAEPAKRNTAPCLALASAVISARYSHLKSDEIVTAVLTADHKIEPKENFLKVIDNALNFVSQNEKLATIGIKPNRPETGYGYIELDNSYGNSIFNVKSFREKPDMNSALEYLASGNFLWNSGMFFWKLSSFNSQMNLHFPEIGKHIDNLAALYKNSHNQLLDSYNSEALELFEKLPSISIDYALMEKSSDVVCAMSDFAWDDVGSWDSLDRVREQDSEGNIIDGNILLLDSKNCTVINENNDNFTVTGFGLENLVIISTGDSIMICPKDKAQDVKKIVIELRNQNKEHLL